MEEVKSSLKKTDNENLNKSSKIVITNQNSILITGISKIITSTESELSAMLNGQTLSITGIKLSVSKLDVESGVLEAEGEVHQLKFSGKKQKENFFKRVFGWCFTKHYSNLKYFLLCYILEWLVEFCWP